MDARDSQRRSRISIVIAVLVCAAMLAVAPWRSAGAQADSQMHMSMNDGSGITPHQLAFRNQMRVLWEQHVAWTRLAIVSFADGSPDLTATEGRLLRNQADIGKAIAPFYGRAAGTALTGLLRQHILIAVDILVDVKAGHQQALTADLKRWDANANRIAAFLHRANPHNWPLHAMRQMMHRHLALTTGEAVAELSGKYAASVGAYDRVEREILGMADMLSTGIIRQFPHASRRAVRVDDDAGRRDDRADEPEGGLRATLGEKAAPRAEQERVDHEEYSSTRLPHQGPEQVAASHHRQAPVPVGLERGDRIRRVAPEKRRVRPRQRLLERPRRDVLPRRLKRLSSPCFGQ